MYEVILTNGEHTTREASDLFDLISRFPDVLYAKEIN